MENYKQRIYKAYVKNITNKYFSFSPLEYRTLCDEFDLNYAPFLPQEKTARILELGCGPGFLLYFLDHKGFPNYVGIDYSQEQVDLAKANCKGDVVQGDFLEYLKTTKELFDLILARHVLEHFTKEEIFEIIDLMRAHLKPQGKLIVEVPNASSPIYGSYTRYGDFTHEVSFTLESIEEVLMATDFEVAHSGPYIVKHAPKRILFSLLNRALQVVAKTKIFFDISIFAVGVKKEEA